MRTNHFVNTSGGKGSWYTGLRVIESYAQAGDAVHLVFADTNMEDFDLYRFLREAVEHLTEEGRKRGIEVTFERLADGRDVWDVFHDVRFLGNSRIDPCSKILKRDLIRKHLEENFDPADTVCYIGIDWSEAHRYEKAKPYWAPYEVKAPLCDPPYVDGEDILAAMREAGIKQPRLYDMGFGHNNCGGFCVKAGMASFQTLLEQLPERYEYHERKEEALREYLGKDVTILQDRSRRNIMTRLGLTEDDLEKYVESSRTLPSGRVQNKFGYRTKATGDPLPKKLPITLREFRERLQGKTIEVDPNDIGGCACFTPDQV